MGTKQSTPRWSDVKTKLGDFDRAGLIGLVQDLYAASKDNQDRCHHHRNRRQGTGAQCDIDEQRQHRHQHGDHGQGASLQWQPLHHALRMPRR